MIEVRHPSTWLPERDYVVRTLLERWLGLEVRLVPEPRADTQVGRDDGPGSVTIVDGLFSCPEGPDVATGPDASFFRPPFPRWRISDPLLRQGLTSGEVPLLCAIDPEHPVRVSDGDVRVNFDLLGAAFHLLSRCEEIDDPRRDPHGRFPLEASLAWRGGFHQRPLVDEYRHILAWSLRTAGVIDTVPQEPGFTVRLTHDVDRPVAALEGGFPSLIRRTGADLLYRRDVGLAGTRVAAYGRGRRGDADGDPSYCFEFLMDVAEAAGHGATFNLLARARDQAGPAPTSRYDAGYRLTDGFMDALVRRIVDRGHAIGLHGSYNSATNAEQLHLEMEGLRAAAERVGHEMGDVGGRQHYLRWTPETWRHLASAGVASDSSVGFAEGPGFRSGTCRPHRVFDVTRRRELPLMEHPLIVMDVTLDPVALRRGLVERVASQIEASVSACRRMRGEFVLLWHNTSAVGKHGRALYRELVGSLGASGA